jgi:hypothetical protein
MKPDTQTEQLPHYGYRPHETEERHAPSPKQKALVPQAERDHYHAQADKLAEALSMATATIERLQRHAPGSAQGTLDVAEQALAEYEASGGKEMEDGR